MEATWNDRESPFNFKLVLIFVLFSLLTAGAIYIATNSHALERHGEGIVGSASQCFNNNPTMMRMINPITKRNADICFDGTKYYVHVTTAEGNPVTTFAKDKMRTIEQVIKYLTNAGYEVPPGTIH